MTAQPRNLFFDLDGTLTDPAPGIVGCYQYVVEQLQLPSRSDASLQSLIGPPLRLALSELLGTTDAQRVEDAVTIYRSRFASWGLYANALYPGVPALLHSLRQAGDKLWIVTSKAGVYATEIARHFDIAHHFQGIYGAELSGERSEKAALIGHLLQERAIEPASVQMIGDRRHDILGAKAHGIRTIGVLWGYGSREELSAAGADAIAEHIEALACLLSDRA